MKIIANTTTHAIHAHYKIKGVTGTETLSSGLNSVEPEVFKAMMKEAGLQKYFDSGRLSVAEGDLEHAADVTDAADSGVESKASDAPKPVATGNQKNAGPNLAVSDAAAIENAKNKDINEETNKTSAKPPAAKTSGSKANKGKSKKKGKGKNKK